MTLEIHLFYDKWKKSEAKLFLIFRGRWGLTVFKEAVVSRNSLIVSYKHTLLSQGYGKIKKGKRNCGSKSLL